MRRLAVILVIVATCSLTIGCSRTKSVATDEAHMGPAAFLQSSVTVKAGQPVKFIDDASGAEHILVVGQNGMYVAQPGAPTELTGAGTIFNAGESKPLVFPSPGNFTVTCTIHPSMLLMITVTP